MSRSCTVCLHPDRKAIDEALFRNKTPLRNVSKQPRVTASALFRHKQHSPISERVRKFAAQLENLPPRKLAYIQGRLDGKSKKQAALDAGFSETMAKHAEDKIETKDVREAFARLVREMITRESSRRPIQVELKRLASGNAGEMGPGRMGSSRRLLLRHLGCESYGHSIRADSRELLG